MKTLVKVVIVLIVGILVYNYFFGDAKEKAQSERIFNEVKEVGALVGDLIEEEHQKWKDGKYDQVLENLKGAYRDLRDRAGDLDPSAAEKLTELEKKRDDLAERLDRAEGQEGQERRDEIEKVKEEIRKLLSETENLVE